MDYRALKAQWDRILAIGLTVAGVAFLVGGCLGVNNSVLLAEQTRYITTGGIGGIFLLGFGATLWISADLRDEWRKLDRIERVLGKAVVQWPDQSSAPATPQGPQPTAHSAHDPEQISVHQNNGFAHVASSRERA
jgi:hypothetical protein